MATYQSGNKIKATDNTKEAMKASAQSRQCPACERKSALTFRPFEGVIWSCRWCGWERYDWDE